MTRAASGPSRTGSRAVRRAAACCAGLALLAACGGPKPYVDPFPDAKRIQVPDRLAGLEIKLEQEATKLVKTSGGKRSYVADGWVYGLRANNELKGVFEVTKLAADARPDDREFRRNILSQIGGRISRPTKEGNTLVYKGKLNEQAVYMWFEGRFLQVLIVREEETVRGEGLGYDLQQLISEAVRLQPA